MIEDLTIEQIDDCTGGSALLDYVIDAAADAVVDYLRGLAGPNA